MHTDDGKVVSITAARKNRPRPEEDDSVGQTRSDPTRQTHSNPTGQTRSNPTGQIPSDPDGQTPEDEGPGAA